MLFKESLISATTSIRTNAIRSFLTSLAIIIGTAAVIAVIGIGSSANKALEASIDDLGGRTLTVSPGQNRRGAVTKGMIPLDIKDASALAKNKVHNWKISPTIKKNRQIKFKNANINQRVGAYLPLHFDVRGYDLEFGRLFTKEENLGRKRVAVLGSGIPSELSTNTSTILNSEILIAGTTYKVVGILKEEGSTGWQSPDEEIYIPLLTGVQRLFGSPYVDSINVGITNGTNVDEAMMTIEQILRAQHEIGPGEDNDFRISDYSQFSDLRRQATGIFTILIAGIAGISLIVGGIGVMNIMLVSVSERTREIGLRKALGATHKAIMLQFIVEAVLLCLIGGLIGALLGIIILYLFAAINEWPFSLPISAMFGSITFSAIVGLFFGIWPARKAAKLDPATSLRYE
ncbi:MAG: MacB protein [Woeseiaceae bacterium]|jgi:putative ABC transport system permease protein|nr:MacB protein [Woeseiaceae bacterium]MBT7275841.1 FtsX-like permease family protein [Woeseiaceae bacterium]MDG1015672.1 ABC transporter permease [Woeseiaceae bacterium]MDG1712688.1 ABC transporter permease [Woeseiaceae bacterium]MDG1865491.1 ABC transporter permease [Woeseiaceae bacterium]|tara:strand:- start:25404 stop:26612 length:1209 start_codon:yes stop_codon:yes gene_type:complete